MAETDAAGPPTVADDGGVEPSEVVLDAGEWDDDDGGAHGNKVRGEEGATGKGRNLCS